MPRSDLKDPRFPELEMYDRETYYKIPHPDGLRPWVFKRGFGHTTRVVQSHALLGWNAFEEGWCVCMTIGKSRDVDIERYVHDEYERNEWMTKHRWVEIEQLTSGQYAHLMIAGNHENYQHKQKRIVHSGIK